MLEKYAAITKLQEELAELNPKVDSVSSANENFPVAAVVIAASQATNEELEVAELEREKAYLSFQPQTAMEAISANVS